jgi:hypothetical protein
MSRTRQPNQSVFTLILTQDSELKTANYIGTFYIGGVRSV